MSVTPAVLPENFQIQSELPEHEEAIERLLDASFGASRWRKAVYRLRDGVAPVGELSRVGLLDGRLIGTLRFWPADVAGHKVLVLGPIAVCPHLQGRGFAQAMMREALADARDIGWDAVVLVGDLDYYRRVGFSREAAAAMNLPGLAEPERLLALELKPGGLAGLAGPIIKAT